MPNKTMVTAIPDFNDRVDGYIFKRGVSGKYPATTIEILEKAINTKTGKPAYPFLKKIIKEEMKNGNKKN